MGAWVDDWSAGQEQAPKDVDKVLPLPHFAKIRPIEEKATEIQTACIFTDLSTIFDDAFYMKDKICATDWSRLLYHATEHSNTTKNNDASR